MPKFSSVPALWWRFAPRIGLGQDCLLCGAASGRVVICTACERSLPLSLPEGDGVASAFAYRFPVDRLVQRFKFGADLAAGRWLAARLAERVRGEPRPALLVATPLAANRLRERGFNQALEIARDVGRELGIPVSARGLVRTRATAPQPGLGRAARRANLEGAFRCTLELSGRPVALVDDVFTTGATADALSKVLRQAGAGSVAVWVAARTPDPSAALP